MNITHHVCMLRDIFLCAIVDAVYWRRRFQGKGVWDGT